MTHVADKLILAVFLLSSCSSAALSQDVKGDLQLWHKVVIDFEGPATSEAAEPNPFADYRLNVILTRPDGRTLTVPGFYAADGRAAETSANSGSIWRVYFTPDCAGQWSYRASFRTGDNIAMSPDPSAGSASSFDGTSATFDVIKSAAREDDRRGKGLLRYAGGHYFQYAGSGEYFLKGGANSPENFLAYREFDESYDADAGSASYKEVGTFIHTYAPHVADWRTGDPTWQDGKGKGIVGMLNYLAGEGMNSVYFLTYNLDGGDGRDTWMWTSPDVRDRFDCSKLDQWEIVFEHMDRLGLQLHVVTQETENDRKLGGSPGLNPIRKLYYRELVARFGHHLAVLWNLGEENNTNDSDRKGIAAYIRELDPYDHPITVHTHNNQALTYYDGILGNDHFEATSIQGEMANYNREAIELRRRSAAAGRKWAIFGDEQPKASHGVLPDADDPTHDKPRKQALWGNLMGGGAGVEWYFGFKFPHMDINCEDWRSRNRMWDQTRYALEFFRGHLPFTEMQPDNELTSNTADYCFAKPGEIYAIYLPDGGSTELKLAAGSYSVHWYNPRTGGDLQHGSVQRITGPGSKPIGQAPDDPEKDWAALIRKAPSS